jgi:thiamine-phosphate pyrophosphorylase
MSAPSAATLPLRAQQIRARLGDWPCGCGWRVQPARGARVCRQDLLVLDAGEPLDAGLAGQWLQQGAGILRSGPHGAELQLAAGCYRLEGTRSHDWLAAWQAFLDCGFAPHDALVLAFAWRDGDEERADPWPDDLARFPRVAGLPAAPAAGFPPCPPSLGLYPVLPDASWVERVLDMGVRSVQLRIKSAADPALGAAIRRCVAAGRKHDARLFINDHWRLAIQAGAYGVHLGQEDLLQADLPAISAAGMRLGLSTHGYYEILYALHFCPSYLALGAVYPTTTKVMPTAPQGMARLLRYARLLDGVLPLVAIGGFDGDRFAAVVASGVGSVGVVRAVTEAADPGAAVARLQQAFAELRQPSSLV